MTFEHGSDRADELLVNGVKAKLAEIAEVKKAAEARLKRATTEEATLRATLRLFGADAAVVEGVGGRPRGSLLEAILEVVVGAGEAVTIREISEALASGQALGKTEMGLLQARVRNSMPRLGDKVRGQLRDRVMYWWDARRGEQAGGTPESDQDTRGQERRAA